MKEQLWVPTYTGREINLLDPNPDDIVLEDIAHHLSLANRYLGCSVRPLSVAEHSVRLAFAAVRMLGAPNVGEEVDHDYWGREAIMHDALEAYTGDLPRMVVCALEGSLFSDVQTAVDRAVRIRFGLAYEMDPYLKALDRAICTVEIRAGLFRNQCRKHTLHGYHHNGTYQDALDIEQVLQEFDRHWWRKSPSWGWSWRRAEREFLAAAERYGVK